MKYLLILLPLFFWKEKSAAQTNEWASSPTYSTAVYFDFGKHDLRPAVDSLLKPVFDYCKTAENCQIRITAHTDSIGSLTNNEALANRRARSVSDYLKSKGLSSKSVRIEAFGETKPATSNASEEGRQQNRRVTVEVFEKIQPGLIEGTVVDEQTGLPLLADVVLHTKQSRDTFQTDEKGYFKKTFPLGTVVGIDAFAKCYFLKTAMAKAEKVSQPVTIALKPAKAGEAVDIDNLYFVGNQPILLEKSKPELPKILHFLQMNPEMKIEIAGHVNVPRQPEVNKTSWEYKLSVDRAKTVHDYLRANGIAADRISYNGYGNWQMRFPNAVLEEQQAQNRRVEIRIIEGGCL